MDTLERKNLKIKKKELTAADIVPHGMGRPVLYEWDQDDLNKLKAMSTIGLTYDQMAMIMSCSKSVMNRRVAEEKKRWEEGDRNGPNLFDILESSKAQGDAKLLRTMYQVATEDRHPSMLIWLSKTRLGMREAIDVNADHRHTFVYETQLASGVLRQDQKEIGAGEIIEAQIAEIMEEACPSNESE